MCIRIQTGKENDDDDGNHDCRRTVYNEVENNQKKRTFEKRQHVQKLKLNIHKEEKKAKDRIDSLRDVL